jgi:hypothetical protein
MACRRPGEPFRPLTDTRRVRGWFSCGRVAEDKTVTGWSRRERGAACRRHGVTPHFASAPGVARLCGECEFSLARNLGVIRRLLRVHDPYRPPHAGSLGLCFRH